MGNEFDITTDNPGDMKEVLERIDETDDIRIAEYSITVSVDEEFVGELLQWYLAHPSQERVGGDESESSPTEGNGAPPDAETSQERPQRSHEPDGEPTEVDSEGHSGSTREGIDHVSYVEQNARKEESIEFLREHAGEWVSAHDYVEWANLDLPEGHSQEINVASAALSRVDSRDWLDHLMTRKVSKSEPAAVVKEYKYAPDGHREGEVEYNNVPGQVQADTVEHETLALLAQLYEDNGDEPQPVGALVDAGRREGTSYSPALTKLKNKSLVEQAEEKSGGEPGTWKPTEAGHAELDRVGGFQING